MPSTTFYATGTVSVANGGTTVTGVGTTWIGKVYAGDLFTDPAQGLVARVTADAVSDTSLSINPWPGITLSAHAYEILITPDTTRVQERTRQVLEALASAVNVGFAPPAGMTADDVQAAIEEVFAEIDGAAPQVTTYTKTETDTLVANAAAGAASRGTVRAATTANVTIATALNNADTVDGVTLATGDLVLVKNQTAPAENGVYVVGVTPVRAAQFDTYNEHPGSLIVIQEGTANADSFWYCTSNKGGTLGSTAIAFAQLSLAPPDGSVTLAKLANLANATIIGRSSAGTGVPEAVTMTSLAALLVSANGIRERLTGARTYYVRSDGSDSNNGLANTVGGAFLTIQKAVDTTWGLDLNGFNVTIQLQDGTWTESVVASGPLVGKGTVSVVGNTGTPANVIWNKTGGRDLICVLGAKVTVSGIEFRTTTSGECLCADGYGSQIAVGAACRFGACAGAHLFAYGGGNILGRSNYSIVGSAVYHWLGQIAATVDVQGITVTLSGTPAFSGAFARATQSALVLGGFNTFSGTATGVRYQAITGGGVDSNAGGASYFPGGTAGSATAPGWYN